MEPEPRASDQPHHRRLVQWGERSVFWYERRHHGKDKANGQEQRGAGRGGREVLQKPEKEGSEEARKTRGMERGLTRPGPASPSSSADPGQPPCGRFQGPDRGYHRPASFTFRKCL